MAKKIVKPARKAAPKKSTGNGKSAAKPEVLVLVQGEFENERTGSKFPTLGIWPKGKEDERFAGFSMGKSKWRKVLAVMSQPALRKKIEAFCK